MPWLDGIAVVADSVLLSAVAAPGESMRATCFVFTLSPLLLTLNTRRRAPFNLLVLLDISSVDIYGLLLTTNKVFYCLVCVVWHSQYYLEFTSQSREILIANGVQPQLIIYLPLDILSTVQKEGKR
jgi:hypothetical protein